MERIVSFEEKYAYFFTRNNYIHSFFNRGKFTGAGGNPNPARSPYFLFFYIF
jgi:hypothetical protein